MPPVQRISQSNHKLYHEALRWTKVFVNLALLDGVLLFLGAAHVLGVSSAVLLGLEQGTMARGGVGGGSAAEEAKRRASALSLATAGVMGLLIALLVSEAKLQSKLEAKLYPKLQAKLQAKLRDSRSSIAKNRGYSWDAVSDAYHVSYSSHPLWWRTAHWRCVDR